MPEPDQRARSQRIAAGVYNTKPKNTSARRKPGRNLCRVAWSDLGACEPATVQRIARGFHLLVDLDRDFEYLMVLHVNVNNSRVTYTASMP